MATECPHRWTTDDVDDTHECWSPRGHYNNHRCPCGATKPVEVPAWDTPTNGARGFHGRTYSWRDRHAMVLATLLEDGPAASPDGHALRVLLERLPPDLDVTMTTFSKDLLDLATAGLVVRQMTGKRVWNIAATERARTYEPSTP